LAGNKFLLKIVKMANKIIINADDYGLSKEFNRGIINLIKKEIVSSVTVMVNRGFVSPEKLLKFDNISIGVHLEEGLMSFEEQIEKFKNIFSKNPSHLDGHKHCHLKKDNLKHTIFLAKKYEIFVRSRYDKDRKILKENSIKTPDKLISWHPKRRDVFFDKLKKTYSNTTEIVCHPGFFDPLCDYPYNKQRKEEVDLLLSDDFSKILDDYDLISYKNIS